MDEFISELMAQLRELPAEVHSCSNLPTDAADTCRALLIGDDHQEPRHPTHDSGDEPPRIVFDPPMPVGQSMMSEDVALRRRSGWHPAYDTWTSDAATIWAALRQ